MSKFDKAPSEGNELSSLERERLDRIFAFPTIYHDALNEFSVISLLNIVLKRDESDEYIQRCARGEIIVRHYAERGRGSCTRAQYEYIMSRSDQELVRRFDEIADMFNGEVASIVQMHNKS